MNRDILSKNDEFHKGDCLMSNNKQWKAVFQHDGNFVIYGWKPVWASDTDGSDAVRLNMQSDSNLVMYNDKDVPRWNTSTHVAGDCNMCHLQLMDDGHLVLYRNGENVWTSADSRGIKN
ncbi:uncharacterized protein V6R79_003638 [Siganus canaliculatus]